MDLLRALRILSSIAQTGGFSASARELGVSTSSVARHMDALESTVGVRLLTRSTRRVGLTEQGRLLLSKGSRALQEIDSALAVVREGSTRLSGVLRITAAPSIGRSILPKMLKPFLDGHPDLNVDLLLTDAVVDLLETGFDLAVRLSDPDAYPDLIVRELLTMQRVVCASKRYLEANGTPLMPAQLAEHSCLLFRPPEQSHPWVSKSDAWIFRKSRKTFEVRVRGRLSSSDADTLVMAALSDLGIIVMPDWMVADHVRAGTLQRLFASYEVGEASQQKSLHLAYQRDLRGAPKIRALSSHIHDWFENLDLAIAAESQ